MVRSALLLLCLSACGTGEPPVVFDPMPDPDAWSTAGPGGPTLPQDGLWEHCAYLVGGPQDVEHHNLVGIYDGWLVLPWAPEDGGGGISLFDFSDPCRPVKVGEGYDPRMRETHTLAFARIDGRDYLAVDYHEVTDAGEVLGGVGIWDLTDPERPAWISQLALPNYFYPDAYLRVTLSAFWQGDALYVAGAGNGVFVVDASDPHAPVLVNQVLLDTPHLVGSFHAIGNVAMSSSAGLSRTVMMDISDPWNPVVIPGGDFVARDADGAEVAYYFANVGGRYGLFARKFDGGGPIVFDISDPSAPAFVSHVYAPDGDGGYIARHEDRLFIGESNYGAVYDFSDPAAPVEVGRMDLAGDFDTLVPIGNVAVASVDEGADPGQATAVIPWREAPDTRGPVPELVVPADGAVWQATTTRIGLSFDEQIEAMSVHPGSLRVWNARGEAVPGRFQAQETVVNFTPDEPLEPDTTYIVEVPAGGIADLAGNPVQQTLTWRFSTGRRVVR